MVGADDAGGLEEPAQAGETERRSGDGGRGRFLVLEGRPSIGQARVHQEGGAEWHKRHLEEERRGARVLCCLMVLKFDFWRSGGLGSRPALLGAGTRTGAGPLRTLWLCEGVE